MDVLHHKWKKLNVGKTTEKNPLISLKKKSQGVTGFEVISSSHSLQKATHPSLLTVP